MLFEDRKRGCKPPMLTLHVLTLALDLPATALDNSKLFADGCQNGVEVRH